jgi:hypothetical protein
MRTDARDWIAAFILCFPLLADAILIATLRWSISGRVREWAEAWPMLPLAVALAEAALWLHWFGHGVFGDWAD